MLGPNAGTGNCYYCQYFSNALFIVEDKWFADCFRELLLSWISVLMRFLGPFSHAEILNLTLQKRKGEKASNYHALVFTFIRCWFIHFVNVFFCTLSLSSVEKREKKTKRHPMNNKSIITEVFGQHRSLLKKDVIKYA